MSNIKTVKSMNGPESLQFTVWTLQSRTEQLHSWILQVVPTQVQFSQIGGVGLQSWGNNFTVSLWQSAATKSVKNKKIIFLLLLNS